MSRICCYCGLVEDIRNPKTEMRPYGPDGENTCHPCAMLPEHYATTKAQIHASFDAAEAVSDRVILTRNGPKPIPVEHRRLRRS